MKISLSAAAALLLAAIEYSDLLAAGAVRSAADYASIQAAIDAHPGRMIYVPPGDYPIAEMIRLRRGGAGLFGPGRIIQTNPDQPIIEIERAARVELRELTLTRPEGRADTRCEAVMAMSCSDLTLESLRVFDNRTCAAAIAARDCRGVRITRCLVQNYVRVSVDDRTGSADWGYAFRCIDGTGVSVKNCTAVLIEGNRIVENTHLPTPELQRQHQLGQFVKRNPQKGVLTNQKTWDAQRVDNWHQGSAILVNGPEQCEMVQIIGNYIENAGQGIDIHADRVIVAQNIINNAHVGMKAMHGSKHTLILGNQFVRNDLWAIGLMPGAASHAARVAADGKTPQPANVDGGSIIANNIISDFGYGHSRWVWAESGSCCPIRLDGPQKPDNPPLRDVIVQGNVVYDVGREQLPVKEPPRYSYAVLLYAGRGAPQGVRFANNIFHPGTKGISNVDLGPLSDPPSK